MKSGFVNIIGKPNVGKSTLMNLLVGEKMSIITHKPQTTRQRLLGILSGEGFQVVFSDTPGYVQNPAYKMHHNMNKYVEGSIDDADILLLVLDLTEPCEEDNPVLAFMEKAHSPVYLVFNKSDCVTDDRIAVTKAWWEERVKHDFSIVVSADKGSNTQQLLDKIIESLPEGPEYFPPDQLTDRNMRYFVSEIIREKILLLYADEIPYSVEVVIDDYKDGVTSQGLPIARIRSTIYVMRETQKAILLGKNGSAMKVLGTESRKAIEAFIEQKAFLEITVKVKEWRDNENMLSRLGY